MAITWKKVAFIEDLYGLAALGDPGADRIAFWDDSETALKWLSLADELSISTTTLSVDHDLCTNFVANEHIDWTNASANFLTTGTVHSGDNLISYYSKGANPSIYNTFVGSDTGHNIDASGASPAGRFNVAIGYRALRQNNTGYENLALGYQSLYSNTIGYRNTAIGYYCLPYNTTGHTNFAIGSYASHSNRAGYSNLAMGHSALYSNTTGYRNVAVGEHALYYMRPTSGEITAFADNGDSKTQVTSVAHGQGNGITVRILGTTNYNGNWNIEQVTDDTFVINKIFVEDDATGWWGIASEGRRNTALGYDAGYSIVTGSQGVFVGYSAGKNETNSYRLYIANEADKDVDCLIYGEFDNKVLAIKTHTTAMADANMPKSSVCFWLDEGNNKLIVKAKYSDGTVKSGDVANLA